MRLAVGLLALALVQEFGAPAGAQQMHKCKDAAGKITYSSDPCAKIGLNPGGEVKSGLVTVAPSVKPKPVAAKPKPGTERGEAPTDYSDFKQQLADERADKDGKRKPRCFIVQTPMGTSTKCLDKGDAAELD
jgi:hypothetical protein